MKLTRFLLVALVFLGESRAAAAFGLARSTDGGATWAAATDKFQTNRINVLAAAGGRFWAGADAGLFVSSDGVAGWTEVGPPSLRRARILSVAVHGDNLVAGTHRSGIWRSGDGGSSWEQSATIAGVRAATWSGGTFWVGSDDGTVLGSEDLGKTWVSISSGLPERSQIFDLRGGGKGRLFAALYSKGFYELDAGVWRRLGTDVAPLTIHADGNVLLGGNNPGGIRRSVDAGKSWRHVTDGISSDAPSWTFFSSGSAIYYGTTGASGLFASEDLGKSWRAVFPAYFQSRAVVALAAHGRTMLAATVERPTRFGTENQFLPNLDFPPAVR